MCDMCINVVYVSLSMIMCVLCMYKYVCDCVLNVSECTYGVFEWVRVWVVSISVCMCVVCEYV